MDYAKNAKNAVSQAVKGSAKFRDLVQSALIAVALESFHSGNVARMDDLLSHLKGADYRAVMAWVKEFTLIRKNEGKARPSFSISLHHNGRQCLPRIGHNVGRKLPSNLTAHFWRHAQSGMNSVNRATKKRQLMPWIWTRLFCL